MDFFKMHARKIVLVAFLASAVSASVSMFILTTSAPGKRAVPETSTLLQRAQNYAPEDPEKTEYNVLLLGYGGAGHPGGGLADTVILANIDTTKRRVNLIAIPRDSWVELPLRSDLRQHHKINAAFAIGNDDAGHPLKEPLYKGEHGGGNMSKYAAERVTGLPVDYYAAIDFSRFERAIDALGGITVDVAVAFNDYFYPVGGLENELCGFSPEKVEEVHRLYAGFELERQFSCRYEHLSFEAGPQKMDGARALKFVRSRHSAEHGGDFARGQRQQAVLTAVSSKLLSLDAISKIDEFYEEFRHLVVTDISERDVIELLARTGDPRDFEVKNINIDTTNYLQNSVGTGGQAIVIPKAGIGNWSEVHEYIKRELE